MAISDWGSTSEEAIVKLAKSFPALEHRAKIEPWNSIDFLASSLGASHGEKLAVAFVLGVWNPGTDWNKTAKEKGLKVRLQRFDVFEAVNVWDDGNRQAFLNWVADPFYP